MFSGGDQIGTRLAGCSRIFLAAVPPGPSLRELSDEELSEVPHAAISLGGTGLSRLADTFVATLCADYLVARVREARLLVYEAGPAPDGGA